MKRLALLALSAATLATAPALAQSPRISDLRNACPDDVSADPSADANERFDVTVELSQGLNECLSELARQTAALIDGQTDDFGAYDQRLEILEDSTLTFLNSADEQVAQFELLRAKVRGDLEDLPNRNFPAEREERHRARFNAILDTLETNIAEVEEKSITMRGLVYDMAGSRRDIAYNLRIGQYEAVATSIGALADMMEAQNQNISQLLAELVDMDTEVDN